MHSSKPLPQPLASRPFTVREASLLGVAPGRLRNPALVVPTRGARDHAPPESVRAKAQSIAGVLPDPWAFSHVTAGRLLGLPMPTFWSPAEALHVMQPNGGGRVRRDGIVSRRGLESRRVMQLRGLPVTDPVTTWADLAVVIELAALVAVGDALLWRGSVSLTDLSAVLAARKGERGVARLREAMSLIRHGSASPQETRARLFFGELGLPEPELNVDVISADGLWLGRVDFLWREARVIVEYEGDQHRMDRRQWQHDIARVRDFEDDGWRVVRITAADLAAGPARVALAHRLRRLLLAS